MSVVAGAVVVLGAGSYGAATWLAGRDATATREPGALAPLVSEPPMEPSAPPESPSASPSMETPAPGLGPATKAGVRQSSRPSPTPSAPVMADEELASAQVSRLIQPRPARSGINAASQENRVTVRHEVTPDGANVRVVSARYDLTQSWQKLWVADVGRPIGSVRCTQNFRADGQPVDQVRPGLLLCWRTSAGKSVVAIATGRPQETYVAAVVEREWSVLR